MSAACQPTIRHLSAACRPLLFAHYAVHVIAGKSGPTMFSMVTVAVKTDDGWTLLSNFRNASFNGSTSKIQLFTTENQEIDLRPDGPLSMFIKKLFIGVSTVEQVIYAGKDNTDGALQCALTAWSFAQHNTVRIDCFEDDDFDRDFAFFRCGTRPSRTFFVPSLSLASSNIIHILTDEEAKDLKEERLLKAMLASANES